jgi:hypothetical protein
MGVLSNSLLNYLTHKTHMRFFLPPIGTHQVLVNTYQRKMEKVVRHFGKGNAQVGIPFPKLFLIMCPPYIYTSKISHGFNSLVNEFHNIHLQRQHQNDLCNKNILKCLRLIVTLFNTRECF